MPMSVSPDKRFLVAAARAKPFSAHTYAIDRGTGALKQVGSGPLAESFPYITHDRTGRLLLSASYGAHIVSVNPVNADGTVGQPLQVIPTARNAHAIITDKTNRFVFVPHLGTGCSSSCSTRRAAASLRTPRRCCSSRPAPARGTS
jgi:6-phosphogluconolactonase